MARVAPSLAVVACLLAAAAGLQGDRHGSLRASSGPALTEAARRDKVEGLPGCPSPLGFSLFSGYVTVNERAGRALFYAFATSESDPSTDPVVLWLNGGPGCSSLGGGFLSELGPFYPAPGGRSLERNEFAWNREANVLFLESPAFVGFSYSNSSADATTGDERTAKDALAFLLGWLQRFPQFRANPFWLSGESYAGHYVPQLAEQILLHNAEARPDEAINFQGFLVGNALTDPAEDSLGALKFWFFHGIISRTAYRGIRDSCDFGAIYPLRAAGGEEQAEEPVYVSASLEGVGQEGRTGSGELASRADKCDRFVQQAMDEMGGINIYDIYADICVLPSANPARQLALMLRDHPAGMSTRPLVAAALAQPDYDPCVDDEVAAYLNLPDVQRALHANVSGDLPGPWVACTPRIRYSRDDLLTSMVPLYGRLLRSGIKMLVLSGDIDAIVPVVGTRRWLRELDLDVTQPWRAWRSSTGQVGGWTEDYDGLSFATVRGAGHMAPYTQPERAFHLFSSWIHGRPL